MKYGALVLLWFPLLALAQHYRGDVSIGQQSLRIKQNYPSEGSHRIYLRVFNASPSDVRGIVRFYNQTEGRQIGRNFEFSVIARSSDDVFADFEPPFDGQHIIVAQIFPDEPEKDDPQNNLFSALLEVKKAIPEVDEILPTNNALFPELADPQQELLAKQNIQPLPLENIFTPLDDSDKDGIPNQKEILDGSDPFKRDTDEDGVIDLDDLFSLDFREAFDADNDGIGDNADEDDDNDGVPDEQEVAQGTNPYKADTDNDGVLDHEDVFPLNSAEAFDFDRDGVGDNTDQDDDDDGIADIQDPYDKNLSPVIKVHLPFFSSLKEPTVLDASGSYDPDGDIQTTTWQFEDEVLAGKSVMKTFSRSGSHEVQLRITDDQGEQVEKSFLIRVYQGNPLWSTFSLLCFVLLLLGLAYTFRKYQPPSSKTVHRDNSVKKK